MPNGFIRPQEISFPVFTYGTQAELIIDCEVFLCEAGSALCDVDFANCLNVQTLSRRRRSVPKQKISVSYSFLPLPKRIIFFRTSLLELPFKTVLWKHHFYLHCLFFCCKVKINYSYFPQIVSKFLTIFSQKLTICGNFDQIFILV